VGGASITKYLEKLGVKVHKQPFEKERERDQYCGAARTASQTLMVGPLRPRRLGQGAVDNAASCVMLMELYHGCRNTAQEFQSSSRLGLEERGLLGSQVFIDAAR
jgi:hypothetical protein